MTKAITLENLKTFLTECKKIFALKSESISTDAVDQKLVGYIKSADVDTKLTAYAKSSDLTSYAKATDVNNKLTDYAKTADVNSKLTSYAKSSDLTAYAKSSDLSIYAKKSDIAKAVNYRGSVNSYSGLPKSGMAIGDMYNIAAEDKANAIKAGDNVVYNGSSWDNLGGTVDLSGYATKEELNQKMNATPFAEESDVVALFN